MENKKLGRVVNPEEKSESVSQTVEMQVGGSFLAADCFAQALRDVFAEDGHEIVVQVVMESVKGEGEAGERMEIEI